MKTTDGGCEAQIGWKGGGTAMLCGGRTAGWVRYPGSAVWMPVCLRHSRQCMFYPPEFRPLREGRPDDVA